ncbi:MAG: hypothetical protein ACYDD1_20025 [Caulobacteraceae bacterium]
MPDCTAAEPKAFTEGVVSPNDPPAFSWPEAVAAIPAAPTGLMALEQRRAECVAVVNASKNDVENIPEYREALDLERLIASSPIQTVFDVRAKLLHVQRGVETGELGTEEGALRQVIDWLADKGPGDASQIASTWNVALANWLDAKEQYRLADVESLRLGQEAKALFPERPEELTLKITRDGVPRTVQLQSYGDIDHWLSDLPHRKGRRDAAIAALSNWYEQCDTILVANGSHAADERLELLMEPMDAAYDEMLRTPTPDAEALNIKFAAILEREDYENGMDILAETARKHGKV